MSNICQSGNEFEHVLCATNFALSVKNMIVDSSYLISFSGGLYL